MDNEKLIILFGSRIKGMVRKDSDYDIAVFQKEKLSDSQKSDLIRQTASEFSVSEDKIDLIDVSDAPPLLRQEIANGKLLHGDAEEFFKFKLSSWKIYLDTAKFRQMREGSLNQFYHV